MQFGILELEKRNFSFFHTVDILIQDLTNLFLMLNYLKILVIFLVFLIWIWTFCDGGFILNKQRLWRFVTFPGQQASKWKKTTDTGLLQVWCSYVTLCPSFEVWGLEESSFIFKLKVCHFQRKINIFHALFLIFPFCFLITFTLFTLIFFF